jgi:hypothetical protein
MKKIYKIFNKTEPYKYDGKKWEYRTVVFEVEVMATVGIWAMVRRKGCVPFVCNTSELKVKENGTM